MPDYVKCDTVKDGCISGKCPYLSPILVPRYDENFRCPNVPQARIKKLEDFMLCHYCVNYLYNNHKGNHESIIKCWKTNYKHMEIKL